MLHLGNLAGMDMSPRYKVFGPIISLWQSYIIFTNTSLIEKDIVVDTGLAPAGVGLIPSLILHLYKKILQMSDMGGHPRSHLRQVVVNSTIVICGLGANSSQIMKIILLLLVKWMNLWWMRWYFMLYTHLHNQNQLVAFLKSQESVTGRKLC